MYKKLSVPTILVLFFTLASCASEEDTSQALISAPTTCDAPFVLGEINMSALQLKGVIVSDEVKTISSPIAGTIESLNCEPGKQVSADTLIANIRPDFNNPATINLSIQKGSLINQKTNLESVKLSTISGFDIQIGSLDNQVVSLKEQIALNKENINLTKKSSGLNKNDLESQILSLENNISSLQKNLELLETAKKEGLRKIDINREGLLAAITNVSQDNLLKLDEVFGITEKNKHINDTYDIYISAKNTSLRDQAEKDFRILNARDISGLSENEISLFLGGLITLNDTSREAMKESVANVLFPQAQIDALYTAFLSYSNNLAEIKNNWDGLGNSKSSVVTNYDTQISSLHTQINSSQTNLENLKTNKTGSIDVGLDLQLSGLQSQGQTLESNLKNLDSQKSNLLTTKNTQILNLENQILQLHQNIESLNTSLSARNIYAEVVGTVKQKMLSSGNNVGPNTPLCSIIPNTDSKKIKIYSPVELKINDILFFIFQGKEYQIAIENVLIYKDPITKNYVYTSNYLEENNFKDGEILSLVFKKEENEEIQGDEEANKMKDITIPVSYVRNKIDGNFVKVSSGGATSEVRVELGEINGDFIEIKSGLEEIDKICR